MRKKLFSIILVAFLIYSTNAFSIPERKNNFDVISATWNYVKNTIEFECDGKFEIYYEIIFMITI